MKKFFVLIAAILLFAGCVPSQQKSTANSFSDGIAQSLVFIDISSDEYSQLYPWKRTEISQDNCFGCAVAPDRILTTASSLVNAEYIKVKWPGQTEYVRADILFIDCESDLCLLQLDTEQISQPLTPITFTEKYVKNAELDSYCISPSGTLITGRALLDTAKIRTAPASYSDILNLIVVNSSSPGAKAKLFCLDGKPVGIASKGFEGDAQLIPAEKINAFLADCQDGEYNGFGAIGFTAEQLVDPALRNYLKVPDDQEGMLSSDVYTIGTGSGILKRNDVIVAIDGHRINSYGRYDDPTYGEIMFHNLITSRPASAAITFEVYRDGSLRTLGTTVTNFDVNEMLIPYYAYSSQPEFIVIGGYVFQQLTAQYMRAFGDDMQSSVPPHMYNYYLQSSFKPTEERDGIVLLSFVLPTELSLGYHNLSRLIVESYNGRPVNSISDVIAAQNIDPESKYDIVEFEQDYPTLVIDRAAAKMTNTQIQQIYGVSSLSNTN